jgi:hypothetical protein
MMAAMTTRMQAGPIRIVLLRDTDRQKGAMRIKLGVPPPAAGLRRKPSGHTIGFHEIHDEGNRHFEMGRSSVPRPTRIDKTGNTFTQIERIAFGMANHLLAEVNDETASVESFLFNPNVRRSKISRDRLAILLEYQYRDSVNWHKRTNLPF